LSLILTAVLGGLSLPAHQKTASQFIRLGINVVCGVGLCLLSLLKFNSELGPNYMLSAWMVPTLCLVYFVNVIITHVRVPGKSKSH
jgi:hypothetical protein